jgi:predicted SnoaL-like aldol condensation-catalyzing enzyme
MHPGRETAERMYDAFNRRNIAGAKGLFSDNFYSHPLKAAGWQAVEHAWQHMWDRHPNLKVRLHDVVADDDRVAVRTELTGFADGSTATMLEMFTVREGRILELWGLSSKPQAPAADQPPRVDQP